MSTLGMIDAMERKLQERDRTLTAEEREMVLRSRPIRVAIVSGGEPDWAEAYRQSHVPRLNGKAM